MDTTEQQKTPPPLAFVDTETTGLDPFLHDAWEFAVILRRDGQDEEHVFCVEPDLANAHPKALEINRYHERTSAPDWHWTDRQAAAHRLYALLNGAVMVGSNPAFDAEMIAHLFGRYYDQPKPWHYRTVDVVPLAAGYLYGLAAEPQIETSTAWFGTVAEQTGFPWKSYATSEAIGVPRPASEVAHTALGDARWARDVWDQVVTPDAFYTAPTAALTIAHQAHGNIQDGTR